ncbi:hypothetical protein [Streptomyces sp. AHA2]|uniref:hypothetical protein n=1 Tax=Streptomyces sp. AHA2 TaxID=3064526 RepID=UPI002FE3336E
MDMQTAKVKGKFFTVVRDGAPVVHITGKYLTRRMAEAAAKCWVAFHVSREPKRIAFERENCDRCGGAGTRTEGGWKFNDQGRCFKCKGSGRALTNEGYRAAQAYQKMRAERLNTTWGELADGDGFKYDGEYFIKGQHPTLFLRHESKVQRHDGAATRQMWKEIAARYKGATLEY